MRLGFRRSCRRPCRCHLIPALKTSVLSEIGGKVWLFWPCDTSVTEISNSTRRVPALHRRSGSHRRIKRLQNTQGFRSLQNLNRSLSGFIHLLGLSVSVSAFILRFHSTSAIFFTCNFSASCDVTKTNPTQVSEPRLLNLLHIFTGMIVCNVF